MVRHKILRSLPLGRKAKRVVYPCVRTSLGWRFGSFAPDMLIFNSEDEAKAFLLNEGERNQFGELVPEEGKIVPISEEEERWLKEGKATR